MSPQPHPARAWIPASAAILPPAPSGPAGNRSRLGTRTASAGAILILHGLLGWGLLEATGHGLSAPPPPTVEARLIEEPPQAPPPPPAPPPRPTPVAKAAPRPKPAPAPVPPPVTAPPAPASETAITVTPPPPSVAAPAPSAPATPVRTGAVIDARISCRLPAYPPASRRDREQGAVTLRFLVDSDGRALDSAVETSSGFPRLDEAARAALALCRFRPATVDGVPERSWARLRYVWKLD